MIARLKRLMPAGTIRGDATRIYALQFGTIAASLVTSVLIARSLGPARKGVVDLFNLLNAFINDLGGLGFGTGLLYFLIVHRRPSSAVHGAALGFSLGVGAVIAFGGFIALPLLRGAFPGLPTWAIVVGCSLAPATLYRLIWSNLLTGLNRSVTVYWVGLWVALATALAFGAIWLAHRVSPAAVIALVGGVTIVAGLASVIVLQRQVGLSWPSRTLIRESAGYGAIAYASAAANTLHFKIDQLLLNAMLGTSAVGVYAVSVRWAETVFLLDSAIFAAAVHRIGMSAEGESYALTRRLFIIQLGISAAAAVGVAIFSPLLVTGMYGEAYRGAIVPMLLLMPGVVAWSAGKLLSQYIVLRRGKSAWALAFSVAGMIVNVAANLVLIPRVGLVGAGIASSVSYGLVIVLTIIAFRYLGRHATEAGDMAALTSPTAATL